MRMRMQIWMCVGLKSVIECECICVCVCARVCMSARNDQQLESQIACITAPFSSESYCCGQSDEKTPPIL